MRIKAFLAIAFLLVGLGTRALAAEEGGIALSDGQSLSYDAYFLEAMMQRQKGNNDAAFDLLQHCVKLNPQAAEAYYYLAQYYRLMKNDSLSQQYYQKAVELEPENATFLETVAQSYISQQDYPEAIAAIERLYDQDKSREDLLEMLYELYQEVGDNDKAIEVLNRMEAAEGKSERLSYIKSELYVKAGNPQAALDELEALAKKYPNDLNHQVMYADMLLRNDLVDEALQIYNDVLAKEPNNTRAQVSLLTFFQVMGDTERADSTVEKILTNRQTTTEQRIYLLRQMVTDSERTDGDSTRVLALFRKVLAQPQENADIATLCAAYMDLKQMPRDSVKAMLHTVLRIAPDNAAARLQLVSYAWSAKDYGEVIALCRDARQYNPDEMAFYYYQGMAYYQLDQRDEALGAFQNGIGVISQDSNPDIVSDFYAVMGDLLHQKGLMREAFEAYDSCLQWKADNVMCLNNYAYYLSELGQQLDRAEQMSYKAIKAEPRNATYLDTYAWILFMQKRYAEAKVYIDQALQHGADGSAVIVEHAGDIYAMNRETDRAVELWREALGQDPTNKLLARKIKQKKYIKK